MLFHQETQQNNSSGELQQTNSHLIPVVVSQMYFFFFFLGDANDLFLQKHFNVGYSGGQMCVIMHVNCQNGQIRTKQ